MTVLNCWVLPLVTWVYKHNEVKKRLVCLVCNWALDLISSIVVPCVILSSYVGLYNSEIRGFDIALWYADVWLEHVVHDFQLLLVASWCALAIRVGFSIGILLAMSDIKDLVEIDDLYQQASLLNGVSVPYRRGRGALALRIMRGLFAFWGGIVLALHVSSDSTPVMAQCLLQVRPWGRSQPACSLVLIDCYSSEINGLSSQLEQQWSQVDHEMVKRIIIRHCTALEMPPMLRDFHHLKSLIVFNSTLVDWNEDATITNSFHPELGSVTLIRVNLNDGELPMGLQSTDFPATLVDIELSTTNLHTLPPDLDTKWPKYGTLYLEKCAFTSIPDVVFRLGPVYLSFQGNPIRELSSEAFGVESLMYLHLGDSLLTALPESVEPRPGSTPFYLLVTNTQVATIPSWINEREVEFGLIATGSPLCFQANPQSPVAYELQLNASNPNIYVNCEAASSAPVVPAN